MAGQSAPQRADQGAPRTVSEPGRTSQPAALVTGAARGVGRAIALRLAAAGWRVALLDSCADVAALPYSLARREELDEAVAACGPGALGFVADVRNQAALDAAAAQLRDAWGGLDAAVAAAGVIAGAPRTTDLDEATWSLLLDVNLTGVWRLCRAALPLLLERPAPRNGRIVAVSSAAGLVGMPRLGGYAAAKHGVIGLVRALAAELGPDGITVNAICPGSTRGPMLDASAALYGLGDAEDLAVHALLGRLLEPTEVAALAAWLCGPEAAGVTGAALAVDAGLTAH